MAIINAARRCVQLSQNTANQFADDTALNRESRRRVTWAALVIQEKRLRMRLAQIEAEKRAVLAEQSQ